VDAGLLQDPGGLAIAHPPAHCIGEQRDQMQSGDGGGHGQIVWHQRCDCIDQRLSPRGIGPPHPAQMPQQVPLPHEFRQSSCPMPEACTSIRARPLENPSMKCRLATM
jgi:hypothetical protein